MQFICGIIWIVAACSLSVVQCEFKFVLSQNKGTWSESDAKCNSIRGTLAVLDNRELQTSFDRDVKPNQGEGVWVGRYVGYTPLMTIEGCYRNQSLIKTRAKQLVNNYLVTCLEECKDTAYIGMQGVMCYCIDSIPLQTQTTQVVSGRYCQSNCPGETPGSAGTRMSSCGMPNPSVNTVSVYRKVNADEINIDKRVANVGECFGYNIGTKLWRPVPCNDPKRFTCDRKPCNGPLQGCIMESNVPSTWIQARDMCYSQNAVLSAVNLTTSAYFNMKSALPDPLYWTGLHRKEIIAWNYDKDTGIAEYSDQCYVAVKQPAGNWQLVVDWCKNPHRYACVQDLRPTVKPPPTNPPTNPPTKPPTTRRPLTPSTTTPAVTTTRGLPTVNPTALPVNVTSSAQSVFACSMYAVIGQWVLVAVSSVVSLKFHLMYIYH